VILAMTLLLLSFFVAALWGVPRLISRATVKIPSRVPEEWVADYNSDH
jgi:Na+-transporting methylmalonyl-CoA/oxaloacetate decarboxylase gamma subunit